jgi:DNA repair protein RadC
VEVDREKFVVVCLDTKNQPTAINVCHVGSLNASIVHPREDIEVTKRLVEAGRIVGIDVLGYLIVCPDGYCCLKKKDTYKNVNFAK